jgi:hypothetical protein
VTGSVAPSAPPPAGPTATAAIQRATYCFARVRGLDPGRLPPSYLVLRLRVRVAYHNAGPRPLIMPLERERTIYTSIKPGATMKVFHASFSIFEPSPAVMKDLPADVSETSPVDPKNDVFTIIPARGDMDPPLTEDIEIPVDRQTLLQRNPDLRGHRLFLRLKYHQRDLSAALYAAISDRWTRFGVPWTGLILTNTVAIDVPKNPEGLPCTDEYFPAGAEAPVTGK